VEVKVIQWRSKCATFTSMPESFQVTSFYGDSATSINWTKLPVKMILKGRRGTDWSTSKRQSSCKVNNRRRDPVTPQCRNDQSPHVVDHNVTVWGAFWAPDQRNNASSRSTDPSATPRSGVNDAGRSLLNWSRRRATATDNDNEWSALTHALR